MSGIIKRVANIIRANQAPSPADYLNNQRTLFTKKYETLQARQAEQEQIVRKCADKENAWSAIIGQKERELSRYASSFLSDRAKATVEQLLSQARTSMKLAGQERVMQQDTLNKITSQLSEVEGVLMRLRSVDYSLEIQKSIREKTLALNTPSSMETHVDAFDLEELSRELRRVEYTTQALIELGGH